MRLPGAKPADARDLEHGCVEWFDYERHARGRGRPGRPRGPPDRTSLPRREDVVPPIASGASHAEGAEGARSARVR